MFGISNKVFFKIFIITFLTVFLTINWGRVSWVFNYKVISNIFSNQQEELVKEELVSLEKKEGFLTIPKIEIFVPLIFPEEESLIEESLDLGAVYFLGSAIPGEIGSTIILGHSAPLGWPKIKYDWIFSELNQLSLSDQIIVYFNGQELNYLVTNKFFLERGEELPEYKDISENILILISCWPPGKNSRRIAVEARKIK